MSTLAEAPVAVEDGARRRRTILLSSVVGTTVEWYDFFLYSTAAGLVFGPLFFPSDNAVLGTVLAFGTFFVGFLARPVGAVIFGHIGDRHGRARSLVTTMLVMGLATAAIGVLPTYEQAGAIAPLALVSLRILQGLAIGGEWAGAILLAVENAPPGRRGWYGSWPQVGLGLGLMLGTGFVALLAQFLDQRLFLAFGWRIAFVASLVLVVVGLVVRLRVGETEEFFQDYRRAPVPILALFRDAMSRRNVVFALLARWADGVAFNTWAVFALTYCTSTLGLADRDVLVALAVSALVMALLIPFVGSVVDRFSPARVYVVGIILFGLLVYPTFLGFQTRDPLIVGIVVVLSLGVAYAVSYAPEGTLFAELFPASTRYTGISFVYQFSGIYASGLTPMLLTGLLALGGGSPWWVCAYLCATVVVSVVATLALRPVSVEHGLTSS